MERFINLNLLLHPYNWIIVTLMVVFAAMMLSVILPLVSSEGSNS